MARVRQYKIKLLPNYFKKIAYGIIVIGFLAIAILKFIGIDFHGTGKIIAYNILLISLLLVAISKDKDEDELIHTIRLQAFCISFIYGVLNMVTNSLLSILSSSYSTNANYLSAPSVLLQMLAFYLCVKFFMKIRR